MQPSIPSLGNALDLMRLLWAVDHALQKTSRRMRATIGITGPQRFVIRLVGRFPGITLGRLAELMLVHPSTVTGIVKRLQARGILEKRSDTRDRRRAFLGLTAKGRRWDVDALGTVEAAVQRSLSNFSESRVRTIQDLLSTLARELEFPVAPTGAPLRTRSRRG
jgi:MarR family transcriptional regulator, organic hydroperoxide resistance regulator